MQQEERTQLEARNCATALTLNYRAVQHGTQAKHTDLEAKLYAAETGRPDHCPENSSHNNGYQKLDSRKAGYNEVDVAMTVRRHLPQVPRLRGPRFEKKLRI